jgi:hypothetical protein
MKNVLIALIVLALAIPAIAGQNPRVAIYLYTTSTGIGGTNYKATPGAGANTSVYVCFDHFGVGGGMYGASWQFAEVPGPSYLSTTNQFAGVGGLTIGDPGSAPGCAMTVGAVPVYPNANGVIVLARVRYETPEELTRGGSITVIPHGSDGKAVADANNALDFWCVHSVAYNGLSGHFGWDDTPVPDGDCVPPSPVENATWGSIKALYR